MSEPTSSNFIQEIIQEDLKGNFARKSLLFRFPPEPNGHLHIGHAKAICLNFGLGAIYKAPVNLRFDDTNPSKEEQAYVDSIKKDIHWLGFRSSKECYTSDYFEKLYHWAQKLIQKGKAYVDEQTQQEIISQRKTPFEKGMESPYRERPIQESLELFEDMRLGKFKEGDCVLRAKIDMSAPNMHLRDPVMYRILKKPHHRTGKQWCIYPTYDWAHGQSDYIEQVSHSLCSLEFDNHRPLYNWYLDQICEKGRIRPKQHEFARLNLSYTVMSKRKLQRLIEEKAVKNWDDPRMPTISGLRRRGYTPKAIRDFCQRAGIAKRENVIELSLLEFSIREELNKIAPRVMAVLNPVKLIIENYPEDQTEWLEAENNPEDLKATMRKVPFSRMLYIEREDFMETATGKFFRLSIGGEVRLKNAYIIKGVGVLKNDDGQIIEIHAQYDPKSRSGSGTKESLRKVKGTLHWVSAFHAIDIEARLYGQLFLEPAPETSKEKDFMNCLNPDSLKIVKGYAEPSLEKAREGQSFQFQRMGYFCVDKESSGERIIFNRTVTLKDGWSQKSKNVPK